MRTIGRSKGAGINCAVLSCFLFVFWEFGITKRALAEENPFVSNVKEFPENVVFFTEATRKVLPKQTIAYYEWPTDERIKTALVTDGNAVGQAKASAVEWIKKVLQDKWIPRDINDRLIPLNDYTKGHDQIRARYMIDNYAIQIIQDTARISILVRKIDPDVTAVEEKTKRIQLAADVIRAFLKEHEKIVKISCQNEGARWRYGLIEGRPRAVTSEDMGSYWWGHTYWKTDGQTVILTMLKFDKDISVTPTVKDWF